MYETGGEHVHRGSLSVPPVPVDLAKYVSRQFVRKRNEKIRRRAESGDRNVREALKAHRYGRAVRVTRMSQLFVVVCGLEDEPGRGGP